MTQELPVVQQDEQQDEQQNEHPHEQCPRSSVPRRYRRRRRRRQTASTTPTWSAEPAVRYSGFAAAAVVLPVVLVILVAITVPRGEAFTVVHSSSPSCDVLSFHSLTSPSTTTTPRTATALLLQSSKAQSSANQHRSHPSGIKEKRHEEPKQTEKHRGLLPVVPKGRVTSTATSKSRDDVEGLIVSAGRQGRTDAALEHYHTMDKSRRTIRHVNAVIDACARARPVRLTQAFAIVDSLVTLSPRPLQPNVYTYGALMNAISRAGQVHTAVQLLDAMNANATVRDQNGDARTAVVMVRPNAVVYQSAVMAAANADPPRPDIALRLLAQADQAQVALTVVGYNAAITAASRAADWKLAVQLLRRMQHNNNNNSNVRPTMAQNSNITTAHAHLSSVPKPDAVTYGTVMAACEKCGEWRQVLQFADEMQAAGWELDGMAISSVLHACQQFGLSTLAVQHLNRMKTTLHSVSHERHTNGREHVGSKQVLSGPDAVAYRLTISACARGGAWEEGLRILDEYCLIHPHNRDVVAYTAAMHGCEVAGKWWEAIRLLGRMRTSGVEPNEITFAAVIGACAKACANLEATRGSTNKAKDIVTGSGSDSKRAIPPPLRKALQIINVMRKDQTVVNPNVQVYNAAMRACAEGLDATRAFQLLQMLRDDGLEPNIVTYGTLMMACQRVGNINGMTRVFQLLRDDSMAPNEIIYGAALSCCRKAGEAERAFLLMQKMIRDGLQPNIATFNTVLLAQTEGKNVNNKDLDRAVSVVRTLTEKDDTVSAKPNRQTYTILIKAMATHKRPRDAEAALRLMRQSDLLVDVELYTATISSYERIGQPLNALRLMESMRADGYDFYEVGVLNTLFKRVVKLANAVGQTLSKSNENIDTSTSKLGKHTSSVWNETTSSIVC